MIGAGSRVSESSFHFFFFFLSSFFSQVVLQNGVTKTMRFTGNMSISEACKDIREKLEQGGPDHSLFRPPNALKHRKGQWMRGDKTFNFYDVISGEELHYRKRHRQMKIHLMDGTEKLVLVDESAPIREVCAEICEKLTLEKPYEEWSLTLGSTRAFLDPVLGLQEQGVTETDKVWLKKKHFWTDDKIDKSRPVNLSLMYYQARFGITHGEHFVTEEEAVSFCALQLQQENGRFAADKHKPAVVFKEIDNYFEEKYQKKKKMHQLALDEWKNNLSGMTELDAMYQYMKLARGLATYGVVMFAVGVVVPGKREKQPELIGVAKTEVMRMDYKTRAILERWPYMMIKRWAATNDMFTLDFGEKRATYYNAYTQNAVGLGQQIQGYLDIMLRLRKQEGTVTEVNDATTTTIDNVAFDAGTVFEYNTTMIVIGDSDGEDMGEGEVVGSDDDDPDPLNLPKPMITPGKGPGGAGNRFEDPDNDPNPVPLPKRLLRPGKGPGGAGDRGPKKVFVSDLATCIDAVGEMQHMIEIPLNPSKVTAVDPDKPRKAFQEGMARLPRELDDPKENAQSIALCLAGIIRAAREVAAKDDDISLLEAARRVAQETEDLLKCSRDLDDDPTQVSLKKRLLVHKAALKGASTYALGAVEGMLVDPSSEQLLLATAKQLADAVNRMASTANAAAENSDSSRIQELAVKMVQLGKSIPMKTQELAPVSSSKAAIAELGEKSIKAGKSLIAICQADQVSEDDMRRVERAVAAVQASSVQLMDATSASKMRAVQEKENLAECLRKVGENADAILDSTGDKEAIEQHSALLADNLAALIAAGKNLAKQDSDTISLLQAAKGVSMAVESLLSTTRDAADDTKNMGLAREMLKTAQSISNTVKETLAAEDTATLPYSVTRHEARKAAAAATELCSKVREVLPQVEKTRQKELITITVEAEGAVQKLIKVIAVAETRASEVEVQEKMAKSVKAATKTLQQLTNVSRTCVPAIEKTAVKTELNQAVEHTAESVRGLVSALQAIPDEGAHAFLAVEKSLEKESVKVDSAMLNAAVNNLVQSLPRLQAVEALQIALVDLQRGMDVMRKAETSALVQTARDLVKTFGEVVDSSIAVAAATSDAAEKQSVLQKARAMIPQVAELLSAAKSEVRGVAQEDDITFLDAARNVSRSLRELVGTDEAEAVRLANRRFLPDINALLKAAKAASEGNDEDANLSLLTAAKTVSASLKDLMATCREEDLPMNLVADVKALLQSVEMQLGDKGTTRVQGESTALAVGAVKDSVTDLLEAARNFEEGPEECDASAASIEKVLKSVKRAPAKPGKATLDVLVQRSEEVGNAAKRALDVASKVPKVARSHPADLAPLVNALVPAAEALVKACNSCSEVLPDSAASAQMVESVRMIVDCLAQISSSSKTAKCDSGADSKLNLAIVDMRRHVRELAALAEKATPGLQLLDDAARSAGDAARFGVEMTAEDTLAGYSGLQAATDVLDDAIKQVQNLASEDPTALAAAAQDAAAAAQAVVLAAQNYDGITRAVAIVQRSENLAQKMRSAPTGAEAKEHAKSLNHLVPALVLAMKEVSQSERNTEVKNAIKAAYGDVKPAQAELIEAAKAAGKRDNGVALAADAADHMVEVLRAMVYASPESRKGEVLITSGRNVAAQTKNAIVNSMGVAKRPADGFVKGQLLMACQDVEQARKDLLATARSMAPGRAELEEARKRVAKQVGEMEAASIAAEIGLLNVATGKTRTQAQESLLLAADEMNSGLAVLLEAARQKDLRDMGDKARPIADRIDATAATSRELAGTTGDEVFQVISLSSAKEVGQAALAFLDASIDLSADPNSKAAQKSVLEARALANDNVARLKEALQTSAEGLAQCEQAAEKIREHKKVLREASAEDLPYATAQAGVVASARSVGKAVQKVQRGARGNAPEIGQLCLELCAAMEGFVQAVSGASGSVSEQDLRQRLVSEAGRTCDETARLCDIARAIASDPESASHATDLSLAFKSCTDALGGAVHGIRDAAVGDKECRDTAVIISKLQADVDSAAIFAETGHFQFGEGADLLDQTASFEKSAKSCLAKAKVVATSTASQSDLAAAAKSFCAALEQLVHDGKSVASSIGDFVEFSVQKQVLVSTKTALTGAQAVVVAASQGRDGEELAGLIRTLGQSLVALVKQVKEASGAATQTQSGISKARELIVAARDGYDGLKVAKVEAKEVSEALRGVSQAASVVIAAVSKNSAKDLLASLDESTEAIAEFLKKAKGSEKLAAKEATGIADASKAVADSFLELLDLVSQRKKDDWEAAERIAGYADTVGDRVADVVSALKKLPGQNKLELEDSSLGEEVVDALKVAVKAVSSETSRLRAPEGTKKGDVGPLLVSATSNVIAATSAMIKASVATQEELLARARTNARLNVFQRDPVWAKGLMVSVEEVVRFTSFLVAVTNRATSADVSGINAAIEELSKAARNLSGGSSKLVAGSKAKSDSSSGAQPRLTQAGQAVSAATQALIEAGKRAAEIVNKNSIVADREPYDFAKRVEQGELKAQLEIARLERELERGKATAKVQAELADSWQESTRKGGASEIDKKMAQRKIAIKNASEDSNEKLRSDAAAAKLAAKTKIAKVETKQKVQVKKAVEEDEELPDMPLPVPAGSDDEDEDDVPPPLPPALSDDE